MATKVNGNSYILPEAEYLALVQGEELWKGMYSSLRGDILHTRLAWESEIAGPLVDYTRLADAVQSVSHILGNHPSVSDFPKESHD